jgi:GTP pyrophosphokinase
VYTPKWDIIELPVNSTVLDFAFRVHTDVGLRFKNAHVNGKIVPIDYHLKTGDIVTISTFKTKITANRWWLRYVATPWSKNKLHKYLRQFEKQSVFKHVEEKINEKLLSYELPPLHSKQDRITKTYQWNAYESILYKIYDGQMRTTRLLREIYTDQMKQKDVMIIDTQEEVIETVNLSQWSVIIDGHQLSNISHCPECSPEIEDTIIARSWSDGIKYHTLACSALEKINAKKFLEAHRNWKSTQRYTVQFSIIAKQKPWALLQLLRIVERFGTTIESLHTQKKETGLQVIRFTSELKNPSTIWFISESILEKSLFKKITIHFVETKKTIA